MNQLKLLRVAFYFILSIANYFTAQAQEINEDDFTLYNKEKGLSGNTITGILQDSIGYIWIATSSGLNKFNGTAFEQFHSNNESWSLPSEHINGILWANKNKLVSFGDGLHLINTRDGHTSNIFIPYSDKQYQYKYNWIISVSSNSIGDLFVLARSGFYQINAQGQIIFRFDYYKENEVAAASFSFGRYLIALGENKYAIVSESGIYYYNSKLKLIKKMSPEDCPAFSEFLDYSKSRDQFYQVKEGTFIVLSGLGNDGYYVDLIKHIKIHFKVPFSNVEQEFDYRSSLIPLNDTTFFINGKATGFYLLKLDQQKSTVDFDPYKFFKDNSCRYVLMDKEKTLWIGTTRGLFHQTRSRHFITQTPIPSFIENRYPNLIVKDICIVGDKICAATRSYAGLLIFDKKFRFIRRIGLENCWRKPDIIYALTSLNNEETLLATNGPLFKVNIKTGVIKEFNLPDWDRNNDWIADLNKDQKGNIWISSSELYKYDVSKNLVTAIKDWKTYRDKIVWSQRIGKDDSGNIWLAGHGLIRYNATSESFDKFINTFPFIKVPDKQVNSFKADHLNNIWINANNNGLICYNTITNSFRTFTTNDGLPDNNITNMIVVKNKLWLSTFSGIACIDLRSFQIKSFGADDGFPEESLTIGTKFFYDEENNKVLIGFKNKIIQFDPDIISEKSQPPKLFIQSLSFENKNKILFPQDNFTTSWRNKDITISIGTINYSTGSTQRFAYKLDEDTTEIWHWLGSNNTFSISNLSSGQHSIQVKLYSAANRWPDQVKRFNIMLSPPYWQETWFQVICIYIIILTLFFLYRWQTGLIQKKERAKTALEQLKAEEYKSQYELEQISNYFSSTLADKHNVDDVLWDVSKNLIGRMNYQDCMIYLWNEDKTKMVQKASYGPKGSRAAINAKIFDVEPGQGVVGYVMEKKEPLIISDTRLDERYRVDDIRRLSEICVPIIHNSELIGIIDSEHSEENHFTYRDIKIITTIATLIGNKIRQLESDYSLKMKQKELASINQQLAEAQLSALQTQMNPHFIFNCLNSIKAMILDNEQAKASRYMSKFANLLRITLNQSKEVFTTLNENIEHLENYLAMEKLRFDDCFTYRITVDEEIDCEETLVPTMMIQPLVENAIWHGLMPKRGIKKLSIHFARQGTDVTCIIEDNGIGIERSEELKQIKRPLHHSVGLSNLNNRIKILNEKYGAGCIINIKDMQNMNRTKTGTCAELSFTILINKPV